MTHTCQKRREIIRKERDGTKRKMYRCAHGMATTYRQEVGESDCSTCVLRQSLPSVAKCNPKPPKDPVYKQPTYGQDAEIKYEPVNAEPPECPEGYTRQENNAWAFDSVWFPCPYRAFNDDLKPDGSLQVCAFCLATRKKIDCSACQNCKGELAQLDGTFNPEAPQTPALTAQAKNYWKAVKKWISAGRPVRSDEDVKKIHANYCLQCDWYDKQVQRCKGCGCKVRPSGAALLNKVRMATEHCPRDFW